MDGCGKVMLVVMEAKYLKMTGKNGVCREIHKSDMAPDTWGCRE
jgi:hypothetical protein